MHEENNNQETELNRIKEIQKQNRLDAINKFQQGGEFEQNNANARSYYSRWLSNRLPILKKNGGFKTDKETQKEYVTQVGDMYDTKVFGDKSKAEQHVQKPFRTILDNNNKEAAGVERKADSLLHGVKDWTKQTIREHDALTDKALDLRFGENVKGYPRYSLLSGKDDVNIGLSAASRFSFGDERDYRGAYGKAIVNPIDSTKQPMKKSAIFLNPKKAVGSTPLHELTHAAQNPRERTIPQVEAIGSMIPVKDEYYDNPLEVHSRLMQFRMENKLDPKKKYTPEEIKSLRKSSKDFNLFERYSDDQMSDLINNIAATADKNRGNVAFAQLGTKLKGLNSDDLLDVKQTTDAQRIKHELSKPFDIRSFTNIYADGTRTKLDRNPTSEQAASISKRDPVVRAAANQTRIIDNKREVAKRKENIDAVKRDGSIGGNTALGDKLRLFKDKPNSFIDDYLNVPSMIGYAADNFNNTVINRNTPETTTGDKLLATGMLAASLYGPVKAKGVLPKINQVVNPVADFIPTKALRKGGNYLANLDMHNVAEAIDEAGSTFRNTSNMPLIPRVKNAIRSGTFQTGTAGKQFNDIRGMSFFDMDNSMVLKKIDKLMSETKPGSVLHANSMSLDSHPLYNAKMTQAGLKNHKVAPDQQWGVYNTGKSVKVNDSGYQGKLVRESLPDEVLNNTKEGFKKYEAEKIRIDNQYPNKSVGDREMLKNAYHPFQGLSDDPPYIALDDGLDWRPNKQYISNVKTNLDASFKRPADAFGLGKLKPATISEGSLLVPDLQGYKKASYKTYLKRFLVEEPKQIISPGKGTQVDNITSRIIKNNKEAQQ